MLNQYIGYAIRIMTACFIASYYRRDFIIKFENLVFILAYISISRYERNAIQTEESSYLGTLQIDYMGTQTSYKHGSQHALKHTHTHIIPATHTQSARPIIRGKHLHITKCGTSVFIFSNVFPLYFCCSLPLK